MRAPIYDITIPIQYDAAKRHYNVTSYTLKTPYTEYYYEWYSVFYNDGHNDGGKDIRTHHEGTHNAYFVFDAYFDNAYLFGINEFQHPSTAIYGVLPTTSGISASTKQRISDDFGSRVCTEKAILASHANSVRIITNPPDVYLYDKYSYSGYHTYHWAAAEFDAPSYNSGNCSCVAGYGDKAAFTIKFLKTGHVKTTDQFFVCASNYCDATMSQYEWTAATIYYKSKSSDSYSSVSASISGDWSNVVVRPTAALPSDTLDVYIVATADDGSTAQTDVAEFSTADGKALARCITPSGVILTSPSTTLKWSHTTEYGEAQYACDLQYRMDNDAEWVVLRDHYVSTLMYYDITIAESGIVHWRVRTYNQSNVAGDWSETSYINNLPAENPKSLVCSGTGRVDITWSSTEQMAYQIMVYAPGGLLLYDTGAVYSAQNEHFIDKYFEPDILNVKLRICNSIGNWSEWIEGFFNTSVSTPGDFEINTNGSGAEIKISDNSKYLKAYLLRNDKPIAIFDSTKRLYDRHASGNTKYSVVFVDETGARSFVSKNADVEFNVPMIAFINGNFIQVNMSIGDNSGPSINNGADIKKYEFFGDNIPTHRAGKIREKTVSISFFDSEGISDSLVGETVYYGNKFGQSGWYKVTQTAISCQYEQYDEKYVNKTVVTMERTKYDDSIEYEY